jgi:hypothetical protein
MYMNIWVQFVSNPCHSMMSAFTSSLDCGGKISVTSHTHRKIHIVAVVIVSVLNHTCFQKVQVHGMDSEIPYYLYLQN